MLTAPFALRCVYRAAVVTPLMVSLLLVTFDPAVTYSRGPLTDKI
jgi:hypothetical protein